MSQTSLFDSVSSGDLREAQQTTLAERVGRCRKCPLAEERLLPVLGAFPENPLIAMIGEAPSERDEHLQALFEGKARRVVDWMLSELNLTRERVFFGNAVCCRPTHNRKPEYEELMACRPLLDQQLELSEPKLILAMGLSAAKALLKTPQSVNSLRGEWFRWRRIPLLVTYHPLSLARAPGMRRKAIDDLSLFRTRLLKETSDG